MIILLISPSIFDTIRYMINKIVIYDSIKFIRDDKTGYYLCNSKIKSKRVRLHRYIWEQFNNKIPKGYHVHHKDLNKDNNDVENLELLSKKEHAKIHAEVLKNDVVRIGKMRQNLIDNARPKACEWHGSKEGREWHKKHYEEFKVNFHQMQKYICEYCGKEFKTLKGNNKFCSNNCKSACRIKKGLDNEKRICPICKKEFIINKYSRVKTCSKECGIKQATIGRKESIKEYNKTCKMCNSEFIAKNKRNVFCTAKCSSTYFNRRKNEVNKN